MIPAATRTIPVTSRTPLLFVFVLGALLSPREAAARDEAPTSDTAPAEVTARAPLPPPSYMDSVLGLIRTGRFEEARHMLGPVVAGHPSWARAQFYLALTYHKEHRYAAARDLFERVLELDPEYAPPRLYFGWCLYYLAEVERARAMFESFLALHPDYPDALFALGLIDFDAGEVAQARARFERAAQLAAAAGDAETEAKSLARLADVDVQEGALEQAKQRLERSIALEPGNYEPYYKLAYVLERLGDSAGAARARARHEEVRAAKLAGTGTPESGGP